MTKMLLAAAATGAAIAAIVLYLDSQNRRQPARELGGAARDAYKTMNANIGHVERNTENLLS